MTSKKLLKILEAFAVVINLTPSNACFEEVSLHPWLPSSFKNTADFIYNIYNASNVEEVREEAFLIAKSLYTNIPNHEGIKAAKEALDSVPKKPIADKVISKFQH